MSKTVSVIITAFRDAERTQEIVDVLHETHVSLDIEPIISSPSFEIRGAVNLRDEMVGPCRAQARAVKQAKGDYIAWITEKTMPHPACMETMVELVDRHPAPFIGEFSIGEPDAGGHFSLGKIEFLGRRDEIAWARWGMMSRVTFDRIGYFDPAFAHHFSDIDLGLRCWRAGGSVTHHSAARLEITNRWGTSQESIAGDREVFLTKWPELRGIIPW
jgi:hypothetical protein